MALINKHNNNSIFSKMLWYVQNLLNKSIVRDADVATPDMSFAPKSSAEKKESGRYEIMPDTTWNLVDVVRSAVSFNIPHARETKYKQYREMVKTNELLATIVDIYADNTVISDAVDGSILRVDSKNEDVVKELEGLFFDRININDVINDIVYETILLGDSFWEVIPRKTFDGIEYIRKLYCPEKISRVEKDGRLIAWVVQDDSPWNGPDYKSTIQSYGGYSYDQHTPIIDLNKLGFNTENMTQYKILAPWQIVHFRLPDRTQDYGQYGRSILAPCLYTWQLLRPLEDSLVVYRIVRAPERFRFYVECGNMSSEESLVYLHRLKDINNKEPFIDPSTGQINKKYLALDALSNYYFPMRNGNKSIEMDTIAAGQNLGEINDIEYFNKKLRIASKIPQAYLQEETTDARTRPLTQLDIQFAKTIQRIQRSILRGLTKIAIEHLFLANYDKEIKEFRLSMTVPSALEKQMRYELFGAKFQLASSIASTNLWSRYTIQKRILGMTEEEAETETQLILWQENNIMPSEGAAASMFVNKDYNEIKNKIEKISSNEGENEMEFGGTNDFGGLGDMDFGGGETATSPPLSSPEPSTPSGGGGAPAAEPKIETASLKRLKGAGNSLLQEWVKMSEALKRGSSSDSQRGLIHLYNTGEIDGIENIKKKPVNARKEDLVLESFVQSLYQ